MGVSFAQSRGDQHIMEWYYSDKGGQQGPVSEDELKAKIRSGAIAGSNLVWNKDMSDWRPVSSVPEFSAHFLEQPVYDKTGVTSAPPAPPADASMPASPYHPPAAQGSAAPVASFLWQSIVVSLLCCQPLGLVAVVYAARSGVYAEKGDEENARRMASSAKKWCLIALVLGLVIIAFYGTIYGTALFSEGTTSVPSIPAQASP